MGYSFRLAARVLLYASSHRQVNTYHGLCYTSRGALGHILLLSVLGFENRNINYWISITSCESNIWTVIICYKNKEIFLFIVFTLRLLLLLIFLMLYTAYVILKIRDRVLITEVQKMNVHQYFNYYFNLMAYSVHFY